MNELSSNARMLVNAARDEAGLAAEERARLRVRVLATAGAASASVAAGFFAKVASAKAFGVSLATWGGVVAVTMAAAGAVYTLTHVSASPSKTAIPASVAPHVNAAAPAVASSEAALPPAPNATSASPSRDRDTPTRGSRALQPKARVTPSPVAQTGFAEDARLLRDVHAALSAGESQRALSLLEARETDPTSGVLAEEREAAKIVTLCQLGRHDARVAANEFLAKHGTSPLAERVRRACPK
jgi:hypothetical protein